MHTHAKKKVSSATGRGGGCSSVLRAVNSSERPHRVQVKVQLLEQVRRLAHGARETGQAFRQMSIIPVFCL